MAIRRADAAWEGGLTDGQGRIKLGAAGLDARYSFASRFEEGPGTNPEELLGAAHAACFSMALSAGLSRAGFTPKRIATRAEVEIEKALDGFKISRIRLITEGRVPGIEEKAFREEAEKAKRGCPVSQALAGTQIELDARLVQDQPPVAR